MPTEIIVSLISICGTVCGSFFGVLASSKLTQYRIEQLEKKVQAHNNLVERMYKVEGEMDEVQHEIRDLKNSK